MPELPEVETVSRRIAPRVEGRRIEAVEINDPRWCMPDPPRLLEDRLVGEVVVACRRRGKYLLWELGSLDVLVMHLRMTGVLLVDPDDGTSHVRVVITLDDGTLIAFRDPRRFGTGMVIEGSALDRWFAPRLGIEPFDPAFDAHAMHELTRGRRAPLKSFLLDQRRIAGIGNIYADEALFRSGLHPLREPGSLNRSQSARLRDAVVDALSAGIDAGGATIDDFRDPDGAWGAYQSEFLVHRREGLPCPGCGRAIVRLVVGGRSTYCCGSCQPRPRRRRR